MTVQADLASLDYGTDEHGHATAVVTFRVSDPLAVPGALDFEVEILLRATKDVATDVAEAKDAFHRVTRSLAEATAGWASGKS